MKNSEFGSIIGRESPIFRSTWVMGNPYQQILVSSTLAFTVQLVVNLETLPIYSMRECEAFKNSEFWICDKL